VLCWRPILALPQKKNNMINKKKGTLYLIGAGIVTAIGAALTSWGTYLKSEDDEAKKEERDDVARKE
jgi:hypothetical protein